MVDPWPAGLTLLSVCQSKHIQTHSAEAHKWLCRVWIRIEHLLHLENISGCQKVVASSRPPLAPPVEVPSTLRVTSSEEQECPLKVPQACVYDAKCTAFKLALTFGASVTMCKNSFSSLRNGFLEHRCTMLHKESFGEGIQPKNSQPSGSAPPLIAYYSSKGKPSVWFTFIMPAVAHTLFCIMLLFASLECVITSFMTLWLSENIKMCLLFLPPLCCCTTVCALIFHNIIYELICCMRKLPLGCCLLHVVSILFISVLIVYDHRYQSFKRYVLYWHCCVPFLFVVVWYSALKLRVILVFGSRDINGFCSVLHRAP